MFLRIFSVFFLIGHKKDRFKQLHCNCKLINADNFNNRRSISCTEARDTNRRNVKIMIVVVFL